MTYYGRGSDPQNFLDSSVSPMLRLPTPDPQFLFAQMLLGSRIATNAINMGMNPMEFAKLFVGGGGASLSPELDRMIRWPTMFPGIVQTVEEFGKGKGDTVKLDRDAYTGGGYTLADRKKTIGKPTSTTGLPITGEQVTLTLDRYRGPFGASGTTVQPYVIDEFDAQYRAARERVGSKIERHLKRDRVKWLDTVIRDLFRATTHRTYADSVADVTAMTASANHTANLDMILRARKAISDREWQPFANGMYLFLVPTEFPVQVVGDPDWVQYSKAHGADAGNPIFGQIARVNDVIIVECTTLKSYAAGDTVPGDGNAVPSGSTVYEGLMMGPGCVGYGVAQDAEARFADDTDYGAEGKIIWDSIEAFGTLDIRACQRVLFQNAS